MHGRCSLSSSSVSQYYSIVNTISHLASLNNAEPQRLHDVNKDLWQRTFLSVMGSEHDKSSTLNITFGLHGNSLPILNPGSLPQPQHAHAFPSPNTPNHYNSASPQPAITGPELKSEPNQDATPTQVQSPRYVNRFAVLYIYIYKEVFLTYTRRCGSRPFSCPDCRTYATNRRYNLKRHRETRHRTMRHSH